MFNDVTPLAGLSSLLATIQQLYPNARVTSGYRGPDNPLTQRNPRSLHALGSPEDPRAVDVAPIPGVSFDQYVNSVKQAGVPIAQSFDEQKHPFPWTTGPNWHLASGDAQVQPYSQPRKRTLADLAPPNLTPDQPSFGVDPQAQMQAPATLGSIAFPQPNVPDHKGLFPGKDWKTILPLVLGAIGDGLSGLSGQQGVFAPMMAKKADRDAEEQQFRERLAAQMRLAQMKAALPPQPTQTDRYLAELGDPKTPPERKALLRAYMLQPRMIAVTGADGSQTTNAYYPDQQSGGDDEWEYSN